MRRSRFSAAVFPSSFIGYATDVNGTSHKAAKSESSILTMDNCSGMDIPCFVHISTTETATSSL